MIDQAQLSELARVQKYHSELYKFYESNNIAELLDEEELKKISLSVIRDFNIDELSRDEWLKKNKKACDIAKQVMEAKSTPWQDASNIKYPLITSAVIAFSSRTYPELIRGNKVVNCGIIGPDPDNKKEQLATRLSDHMSYQLLIESENWEPDTDKLLTIVSLMGLVYRKSYFDHFMKVPATDLCMADKITVNENVKSIETARRITHQLDFDENQIIERMRMGIYTEYPMEDLRAQGFSEDDDPIHEILEQHRFLDLDGDGYKEPYIVTVHKNSRKILRILARFDIGGILLNDKNKIIKIHATCYFTDYHFLRNPDGSFHSLGYGTLLYPLNEAVNTLFNQLIDAGTLSNRQCGFISRQFRNIKGPLTFKPGEIKTLDVPSGTDIARNIYMLPVNQPSSVLFQLLGMLINATKELANITEVMQGSEKTQNSPATTVLAMLEQGMKDQKAILKRLYRSFKKEFEKLVRINRVYLDEMSYTNIFSDSYWVSKDDFANKNLMVFPVADPSLSSDAQRLARAQALMQFAQDPDIDGRELKRRYFEAMDVPNLDKLFRPPPDPNAPPPPEVEKIISEAELNRTKARVLLLEQENMAIRTQATENQTQVMAVGEASRTQERHDKMIVMMAELLNRLDEMDIRKAELMVNATSQDQLPPEQQINLDPPDTDELLEKLAPQQQMPPQEPPMPGEMPQEMPMQGEIPPEMQQQQPELIPEEQEMIIQQQQMGEGQ